jgi:ankyrin repeat protein
MISHGATLTDTHQPSIEDEIPSPNVQISPISSSATETLRPKKSLLQFAAGREIGSVDVVKVLLQSDAELPNNSSGPNIVLLAALEYFDHGGRFRQSRSLEALFNDGPAGIVKILLLLLRHERVGNSRYGLLLQMAIAVHDVECIDLLIERGVDVNLKGGYYGTALQCAARFGYSDIVRLLLRSGAQLNILGGKHDTALRGAVVASNETVVDTLIAAGADVNLRVSKSKGGTEDSKSVLHLAVETKNYRIVKRLVEAGADVNLYVKKMPSAVTLAVESGKESIVRLLINSGATVDAPVQHLPDDYCNERASALHMACSRGYESIARLLIDHGADINLGIQDSNRWNWYTTRTPLQIAVLKGTLPILRLLVLSGVDIDYCNYHGTALCIAAKANKIDMVEELLTSGASIKTQSAGSNALEAACKSKNVEIIGLLVEELSGTPLVEATFTDALTSAASNEDDQTFRLLLDRGAPISAATLSQACGASLRASALALVDRGVDVNGEIGDGGLPIHVAAFQQRYAVVEWLLSCGASAEIETTKYGTPLQALAEGFPRLAFGSCKGLGLPPEHGKEKVRPWEEVLSMRSRFSDHGKKKPINDFNEYERVALSLISRQNNMNTKERSFGTPLHLAAYVGSVPCVRALLAKGANLNATSDRFGTAIMAAIEGDNNTIVEILLRNEIDLNHTSSKHGRPLHYACKEKRLNAVKMLLQHGTDVNAVCDLHSTPFSATISKSSSHSPYGPVDENMGAIVGLLVQQSQFRVQDLDVISVASANSEIVETYLPLLLDHESAPKITESVLVPAIRGSHSTKALEILFQRDDSLGITRAMVLAANDPKMMEFLLDRQPICPITTELVCSAGRNEAHDPVKHKQNRAMVEMLIDHEPNLIITEELMITALASSSRTQFIEDQPYTLIKRPFERKPDLIVTENMLKSCEQSGDMRILLKHAMGMRISPQVLEAVSNTFHRASELVPLLLEHDDAVQVPQVVIDSRYHASSHKVVEFMTAILERSPDLKIPIQVLEELVCSSYYARPCAELFLKHGKRFVFTDKIRKAIEERFESELSLRELLEKLEDTTALPAGLIAEEGVEAENM